MTVSITPYIDETRTEHALAASKGLDGTAGWIGEISILKTYTHDSGGYWRFDDDLIQFGRTTDFTYAPHVVTALHVGQLEDSSHKLDGSAFFGTGNLTSQYLKLFDHSTNVEFGLETHYRTGDYVNPVNDGHGNWIATMDHGLQNGQHNEQGSSTTRSAASFDVSMNFGNFGPVEGQFKLVVQSSAGGSETFTLGSDGANHWFFADHNGAPLLGLTLSPNGHVLQDSVNLAFLSGTLAHGANAADISAQDVHVSLIEMDSQWHTIGVAAVSETIHLV